MEKKKSAIINSLHIERINKNRSPNNINSFLNILMHAWEQIGLSSSRKNHFIREVPLLHTYHSHQGGPFQDGSGFFLMHACR